MQDRQLTGGEGGGGGGGGMNTTEYTDPCVIHMDQKHKTTHMPWVGVKNFGFTEKQKKNIEQGSTKLKELHVCIMVVQKKMAAKLKELHVCIMRVQKKMAAWRSEMP